MSQERKMSIFLITTSTAAVLAMTAIYLARPVGAMATRKTTGSPGGPEELIYRGDRMERDAPIEGLLINECCSEGKILNDTLECEDSGKKDTLDAIANSISVNESLNPARVNSYQILPSQHYRDICSGDKFEVVYWPKDGQLKTHYINHKTGELLLVSNETIVKKFSPTTYCVDEASHDGKSMYALMMCPCTVSTCIQKCCPEGEYFDTTNNKCAPLNRNISGFHPQLHHMKNESYNNTQYYLTEGNPQCVGELEKLELNVTKAYPQESGWLMVDDGQMGRYQFYQLGKYCLDTFSDPKANKSTLGGFICTAGAGVTSYTYQEAESGKEMLELEPSAVRASKKLERSEEVLNIEDRSDYDSEERADEEKQPEINIKSFDSKAGAVKIAVFWEMVVMLLVVTLYKK